MNIMEEYRSKRLMKRIRLRELSATLDCTIGLISNWENARRSMLQDRIQRYMEYIDNN